MAVLLPALYEGSEPLYGSLFRRQHMVENNQMKLGGGDPPSRTTHYITQKGARIALLQEGKNFTFLDLVDLQKLDDFDRMIWYGKVLVKEAYIPLDAYLEIKKVESMWDLKKGGIKPQYYARFCTNREIDRLAKEHRKQIQTKLNFKNSPNFNYT